jgi:hypothetical protein
MPVKPSFAARPPKMEMPSIDEPSPEQAVGKRFVASAPRKDAPLLQAWRRGRGHATSPAMRGQLAQR